MQNWEFHAAARLCDLHAHTHHRHQEQFARNTQNSQGGDFLALCKSEAVAQESKPMFPPPASRASPESIWGAHLISSLRFLLTFFCWTFRLHSINGGISHSNRETKGGKGIFKKLSLHKKCLNIIYLVQNIFWHTKMCWGGWGSKSTSLEDKLNLGTCFWDIMETYHEGLKETHLADVPEMHIDSTSYGWFSAHFGWPTDHLARMAVFRP